MIAPNAVVRPNTMPKIIPTLKWNPEGDALGPEPGGAREDELGAAREDELGVAREDELGLAREDGCAVMVGPVDRLNVATAVVGKLGPVVRLDVATAVVEKVGEPSIFIKVVSARYSFWI